MSTPLLAIPAVYILYQPLGVQAKTISLIVAAFFALGHHLPGMMRAYGDRELFERFKTRFILAPILFFGLNFPLREYYPDFIPFLIVLWATWHGLMQLYGFVRIYDSKVGSTSSATVWWDWLVCFVGFFGAQLFCPSRVSNMLRHWYGLRGWLISPDSVRTTQMVTLVVMAVVLVGFCVNYVYQYFRGVKPNPIKLLLLVSGIGTWFIANIYVENMLLGIALFDICHDVQYLAIVWVFNCRRVSSNPNLGSFMSFVFRRGMVLLYVGLIAAYGALGIIPALVDNGTVISFMTGVIGTSTLLHYYYDGFIWKVREKSTQATLGLNQGAGASASLSAPPRDYSHLLKWSPLIAILGLLFLSDYISPTLAQSRKTELTRMYSQSLMGRTALPPNGEEASWLLRRFDEMQTIASAVPNDPDSQVRAAIMMANFGRNEEAVAMLQQVLKSHPDYYDARTSLAEISLYRGQFEQSEASFLAAMELAKTPADRALLNLKLGEICLRQKRSEEARQRLQQAIQEDPALKAAVEKLQKAIPVQ